MSQADRVILGTTRAHVFCLSYQANAEAGEELLKL